MCRPQSAGGRRCPLHSHGGFVGTRLARRASGLDTRQTNAAFQALRLEGARAEAPTVQQWADYLQQSAENLESSGYGSRTMRAMREHIAQAANDIPDGPTFYALTKLEERASAQRAALNEVIDGLSETLGISRTAARRQFAQLRTQVDMSRGAEPPSGYSRRVLRTALDLGMPVDMPSLHALGVMTNASPDASAHARRRVELVEFPDSRAIHSAGYDQGRLEVRFRRSDGEASEIYAYRYVPPRVWRRMQTESPGRVYNEEIRNNSAYRYESREEEQRDSTVRRCAECGQFASYGHTCPPRRERLVTDSDSLEAWLQEDALESVLQRHSDDIPVDDIPDGESESDRAASALWEEYQRDQLEAPEPEVAPEEVDIAAVQNAITQLREELDAVPTPVIPGEPSEYGMDAFSADYEGALRRIENGEEAIPFMTENATNGLLTPENNMGFGVEIEFDDGGDYDVRERIGRRLYEEGLTSSPEQRYYHSAHNEGWTRWSFEEDETVAGEIVSPVLYDRPEDWEALKKVCDIVREEGGQVSFSTGGHIHISSAALGYSVSKHAELLNTVRENEDLIYRLGTNPNAERHRTTYWCAPNPAVDDSYERHHANWPYPGTNDPEESKFYHFRSPHGSHNVGINMLASGEGDKSHVEFRQFDATLDPAIIQAQVKLSAAMVAKAAQASPDAPVVAREQRPVGYHARLIGGPAAELNRLDTSSQSYRALTSQLFTRPEDRAQMTALFASTKWQQNLPDYDETGYNHHDYYDDDYYDDRDDDYSMDRDLF